MKLGVAATAPFGADVLERLARAHDVAVLVTRLSKPAGRGRRVTPPPAKIVAERLGIPVLQVDRFYDFDSDEVDVMIAERSREVREPLALRTDVALTCGPYASRCTLARRRAVSTRVSGTNGLPSTASAWSR